MKASNFSDAQKAFIIKQGENGTPVAEICRKAGISQGAIALRCRLATTSPQAIRKVEDAIERPYSSLGQFTKDCLG